MPRASEACGAALDGIRERDHGAEREDADDEGHGDAGEHQPDVGSRGPESLEPPDAVEERDPPLRLHHERRAEEAQGFVGAEPSAPVERVEDRSVARDGGDRDQVTIEGGEH